MVDAYVLGDDLPEVAAALELAKLGLRVRVAAPPPGRPRSGSVPDPEGALAQFLRDIAEPPLERGDPIEAARPTSVAPSTVLLRDRKARWRPQPVPALLGIPAVPLSTRVTALIGGAAAIRSYVDRVRPVLTIGKTHGLGALVRSRMGQSVLDQLVEPFVRERFGRAAEDVEVALAAPGLNEALTRVGSLSGAVLALVDRTVARETLTAPEGGWQRFDEALRSRLEWYGVEFATLPAERIERDEDRWRIIEGDTTVDARSLIFGVADSVAEPVAETEVRVGAELIPQWVREQDWRAHCVIEVLDPGKAVPADSAAADSAAADSAAAPDHADTLRVVEVAGQGRWSVRMRHETASGWVAEIAGPATSGTPPQGEALEAIVTEVAAAAGLRLGSFDTARVNVVVAPDATVAGRDARQRALDEQREADPELLFVGAGVHAGELAASVSDAQLAATQLRRRLSGIAD